MKAPFCFSILAFLTFAFFSPEIAKAQDYDLNPYRVPYLFVLKDTLHDGGRIYVFEVTKTATWDKKTFVLQLDKSEELQKILGILKFIWAYESPEELTFSRWQEEFGRKKEKTKSPPKE